MLCSAHAVSPCLKKKKPRQLLGSSSGAVSSARYLLHLSCLLSRWAQTYLLLGRVTGKISYLESQSRAGSMQRLLQLEI